MKKSKRGTRYIKRVELIPEEEFKTLGVFQSMIERFKEHTPTKGHDHDMRMIVTTPDGDLKTMEIEEIVCRKDDFVDAFSDGRTLCAVKLIWSDGSWEYGFKLWERKERVYRKNCKLQPLFAKVGVVNDETGEIEDIFDIDKDSRIPAWILELIPRYNERIRDGIWNNDKSIETKTVSLSDWEHVQNTLCSNYVSTKAHFREISIGKEKVKMPTDMVFDKNVWWKPVITEWKDQVCKEEWGAFADMLEKEAVKVFCYSYIKSIYCNNYKSVRQYKVIPLADVLALNVRKWDGDKHDWVENEVWNSLDETCKGNV
jgi:hypothetical protein